MKAFCRVRVGKDFSAIIKKRIKGHKLGKRRPVAKRFKKGQWLEGHFQEVRGNLMFRLIIYSILMLIGVELAEQVFRVQMQEIAVSPNGFGKDSKKQIDCL